MKHLELTANAQQKQALAKAIAESGLDQKIADIKQYNSSFSFENNDQIVIESGYATPHTFKDRNGQETEFLGFDAKVKRGNRTFDIVVSLRSLTSPTFSLDKSENIQRGDLRYRYRRQVLEFEDIELKDKTTATLAKLPNPVRGTIVIAEKAYLPDFDSYDKEAKAWATSKTASNYGYLK